MRQKGSPNEVKALQNFIEICGGKKKVLKNGRNKKLSTHVP
jgi:hypothetical protein